MLAKALVVGSNIMISPENCITMNQMKFLSPESRCYSFDHRANGYSRGEGIVAMVLKRTTDAVHSNDTVRAVVRSTAINHCGHSPGLTQPNTPSQIALIQKVYEKAALDFSRTRYIEAHGTPPPSIH
jgi:acyl transferase domain-containing protein